MSRKLTLSNNIHLLDLKTEVMIFSPVDFHFERTELHEVTLKQWVDQRDQRSCVTDPGQAVNFSDTWASHS